MYIPFCPLPVRRAKVISKKLYGIADRLSRMFPNLDRELKQSRLELDKRDYIGIVVFSSLFVFVVSFIPIFLISLSITELPNALLISLLASSVLFLTTFLYQKMYPKLLINKRTSQTERNLLHALRHLYVQVKSGVALYDAIVSVSNGNYGYVSDEFKRIVKNMSAGMSTETAFENIALDNPSQQFHRAIWQLSNGMKTGSDIGIVLKSIVDNLAQEQKVAIRRYGSQLNPLTLVYMMVAVIMPALGITLLIILSSFSGFPVTEKMFLFILGALTVFQFMFIGIIKSRRPNL
ncbi:MAG: type II secretion system F family protein [Candidatus Aenigmarchaeota archaeon]|nr:type II secretion system F family protein [Candidatus Aenigmarchaeota archaeon]